MLLGLIYLVANDNITFFLWPSNSPLCLCTTLLSIHPLMATDWFHVLAILNNVAVNIWLQIAFQISDIILRRLGNKFFFIRKTREYYQATAQ